MKTALHKLCLISVCALCRLLGGVLRLLGQGGTSLPGRLALKLYPGLLERLSEGVTTVVVTGTNGKTTTCGLLRHMAERAGIPYISNASGANLIYGVAAAFAQGTRFSKSERRSLAIIECDEGTLTSAAAALRPEVIVVTNLFRDQLDRYGEITHTRAMLLEGIKKAPEAKLCLNADCSLTASLALEAKNEALFFGMDIPESGAAPVSDAPRCFSCGGEYAYESRTFAHLGHWYCPNCGGKRPAPQVLITSSEAGDAGGCLVGASVFGEERAFRSALDSDYNLYNIAAALTAAGAVGWDIDAAAESLADAGAPFGRGETLRVGKTPVRLFLAKNPAGMDRLLDRLSRRDEPFLPVFCLNDNYADGRDVSWIWDCDFESFIAARRPSDCLVWGTRRRDMLLRLQYASEQMDGRPVPELKTLGELRRRIAASPLPAYVVANYTAMLAVRKALAGRKKWN